MGKPREGQGYQRVWYWVVGALVGAFAAFSLYYAATYRPLGGSVMRTLVLPSVVGGLIGGMLADRLHGRFATRSREGEIHRENGTDHPL